MIYLPYLILSLFYLTAFWTTIIDPYSVTALAQLRNFVSSFFWIKVSWLFWHGIGVYFLQQWFKLWNVTARNAILLTVLIFSLPLYVFIVFQLKWEVVWLPAAFASLYFGHALWKIQKPHWAVAVLFTLLLLRWLAPMHVFITMGILILIFSFSIAYKILRVGLQIFILLIIILFALLFPTTNPYALLLSFPLALGMSWLPWGIAFLVILSVDKGNFFHAKKPNYSQKWLWIAGFSFCFLVALLWRDSGLMLLAFPFFLCLYEDTLKSLQSRNAFSLLNRLSMGLWIWLSVVFVFYLYLSRHTTFKGLWLQWLVIGGLWIGYWLVGFLGQSEQFRFYYATFIATIGINLIMVTQLFPYATELQPEVTLYRLEQIDKNFYRRLYIYEAPLHLLPAYTHKTYRYLPDVQTLKHINTQNTLWLYTSAKGYVALLDHGALFQNVEELWYYDLRQGWFALFWKDKPSLQPFYLVYMPLQSWMP